MSVDHEVGPPCAAYAPNPEQYPRVTSADKVRWIGEVYTKLFGESCSIGCTHPQDPAKGQSHNNVMCRGTSVTEACLGCLVENACASSVLRCANVLAEEPRSLRSTELAVLGKTNIPDPHAGISDQVQVIIGVVVSLVVITAITIGVLYGLKRKRAMRT